MEVSTKHNAPQKKWHSWYHFEFSKLRKRVFLIILLLLLQTLWPPLGGIVVLFIGTFSLFYLTYLFPFLEFLFSPFLESTQFGLGPTGPIGYILMYGIVFIVFLTIAFILSWPANFKRGTERIRWRDAVSLRAIVVTALMIMLFGGYSTITSNSAVKYLESLKTSDGGNECTDNSQCEGYCAFYEFKYDKRLYPNAPDLPKDGERVVGECSRSKQPICDRPTVPVVEDGIRKSISCDEFPLPS